MFSDPDRSFIHPTVRNPIDHFPPLDKIFPTSSFRKESSLLDSLTSPRMSPLSFTRTPTFREPLKTLDLLPVLSNNERFTTKSWTVSHHSGAPVIRDTSKLGRGGGSQTTVTDPHRTPQKVQGVHTDYVSRPTVRPVHSNIHLRPVSRSRETLTHGRWGFPGMSCKRGQTLVWSTFQFRPNPGVVYIYWLMKNESKVSNLPPFCTHFINEGCPN